MGRSLWAGGDRSKAAGSFRKFWVSVLRVGVVLPVVLLMGGLELGRLARAEGKASTTPAQSGLAEQKARADRLFQQGTAQSRRSQFREALQSWEAALRIYREVGDRQGEGNSLGSLGLTYYSLSQYERAIDFHQQYLTISREIGDRQGEATSLGNLGNVHYSLSQYKRAIYFYQQHLAIARDIGDRQGEAAALGNLGVAYYSLGQYKRAIDFHQQSLAIARDIGDRQGEAAPLGNLGLAYGSLGQYKRAINFHQQSLAIARDIGDRQGEANSLGDLGGNYLSLGQYERAVSFYQQSLAIKRDISDRRGEAISLSNLGLAYDRLGQYERAIDFHQQSLAIALDIGNRQVEANSLGSLGDVYASLGQYERAIDFNQQSLAIALDMGDRQVEANSLGSLGSVHNSLGQYERAINFHEQYLIIARDIGDRRGEAASLGNLGNVYDSLGQYERAISSYHQSLTIARDIGDRQGEAASLGNLGRVYNSLGQYERAINFHQQYLIIARDIGDRQGEATSLGSLGATYSWLGQYERAINFHQQHLTLARDIGDRRGEASSLHNQGVTLLYTKDYLQAELRLRQAVAAFESLRSKLSDNQLISIADTQSAAYNNLERALTPQNKITDALTTTEQGRAQAFALQLKSRSATPNDNLTTNLTFLEIQHIARDTNTTLVTYSLIFNQTLNIYIVQPNGNLHLRSIPLADDTNPNLTADLITNLNGPLYRNTPPSELTSLVTDTRASVTRRQGPTATDKLKDLHNLLIDPIADLLPIDPTAKVAFIPDDNLFLVPFAALQDQNGTHLIEKHTLLTAPSIQVYGLAHDAAATQPLSSQPSNPLIVGDPAMPTIPVANASGDFIDTQLSPLPGAKAEAKAVGKTLNATPLIGSQATEAQVKQQLPTADLIHLATHGLLQYGDPQAYGTLDFPGAIALTPTETEDGLLTSAELLEMDLQASLAILSACDTGRGRITGDGVVGLSRSLITAGVPSVIVSLWAVPDAPTAELMTEFYEQLDQGQDKAQALRQAMLTTMKQHSNPRDWAAFTLMGSGS